MEKRIAVVSAILDNPTKMQFEFNKIVSDYKQIVKGRMGIPFQDEDVSVVSITVVGTVDEINSLTGKLGSIKDVIIKTSISKKKL